MNTFELSLDLDKRTGVPQWVILRQGDRRGTELRATIYDHGEQVGGGYSCRVSIRLPGPGAEYYRETANYSNGVAVVTVNEEYAAAVVGNTYGYFELLQGSTVIASTESFGVRVLPSAQDGAVPGEKYDSAIEDALAELDEATGHISQMVVDATEEYLEAHPEITTTVQDNSLTDSKLVQKGGVLSRVGRLMYRLANLLTATPAEAEVVTVTDAAKTPLAGLSLYGKSTQDGTPTPDAPVPIKSVTPNLLGDDFGTWVKSKYIQSDDSIANNGNYMYNEGYVPVQAGLTYTLFFTKKSTPATVYGSAACYDSSKAIKSRPNIFTAQAATTGLVWCTFTVPAGTSFIRLNIANDATDVAMYEGIVPSFYAPHGHAALGVNGRNLLKLNPHAFTQSNVNIVITEDAITLNGTASASGGGRTHRISEETVLQAGTYAFGVGTNAESVDCFIERVADNSILANNSSTRTFTLSEPTAVYFGLNVAPNKAYSNTVVSGIQLEVGSTPTSYQPYESVTIPIDLQGHALRSLPDGTRDEVNVDEWGHAVLTQRVGSVDMGNLSYTRITNGSVYLFDASVSAMKYNDMPNNLMCSGYEVRASIGYGLSDKQLTRSTGARELYFRNDAYTDVASFKAAMSGIEVLYALATPVTIDLGTVDPVALVGPDMTAQAVPTAPFQLTYERDLDATLARLEAAGANLAPVDGPTAETSHAAGSYLVLDGRLVRATRPIVAGETIAIGTNVAATTVAAEIDALR